MFIEVEGWVNCCNAPRGWEMVFVLLLHPTLFGAALLFGLLVSLMYTSGSEEIPSIVQRG
jgi:hypothetical protein